MIGNLDLEADVLGGLMLSSTHGDSVFSETAGSLGEDAFVSDAHRCVYDAICELASQGKPHDSIAIVTRLKEREMLAAAGDLAGVMGLATNCAGYGSIGQKAKALRDYANRRAIAKACREAMEAVERSEAADVIATLGARLDAAMASGVSDAASFAEVIVAAETGVMRAITEREGDKTPGVPFGVPALDALTGGMRPGELIGVAARTSVGKTALANQFAIHAASHGHPGLIVSLEESHEGIGLRAISNRSGINLSAMRSGSVDADSVDRAISRHGMRDYPLWVDTKTFDLRAIVSRITQYRRRHKIKFAVVDHIGLVRVPSNGQKRYEQIGEVTRTLKQLAAQIDIPIMCLIQVGRESEKESRQPRLSDLRESGNIEQDLNVCIAMHPKAMADESGVVPLQIGLLKNRYGPRCWLNQEFEFHGSVQQLRQLLGYGRFES